VGGSCKGCAKKSKPAQAKSKCYELHDAIYYGLSLPVADFDYDEFVAREFGRRP
jgi:hypothetical protein